MLLVFFLSGPEMLTKLKGCKPFWLMGMKMIKVYNGKVGAFNYK